MPKYEPFDPGAAKRPALAIAVRRARKADAPAIAQIDAERAGTIAADIEGLVRASIERGHVKAWVAESDGRVVAFAKVGWIDAGHEASLGDARNVESGHYLSGVVVEPQARRRGVGRALTQTRLSWIAEQGGSYAYYTANQCNATSIAMHASLGFEEVSRDIRYPSFSQRDGQSLALFRCRLEPEARLEIGAEVPRVQLLELYASVGWTRYTDDADNLVRAVERSQWVATRWSGEQLAALCRVVTDDASIAYVQDLLVHPDWQRRGLGSALLELASDRYAHVAQLVLLTDDRPGQTAFYESMGLADIRDLQLRCFMRTRSGAERRR